MENITVNVFDDVLYLAWEFVYLMAHSLNYSSGHSLLFLYVSVYNRYLL